MWHMSVFKNTNDNHYIQCCILCSFVNNMNTTKNRIEDWLTEPPKDLRSDSTDEEVWAIHQRIIEDAIARHFLGACNNVYPAITDSA